MREIILLLLSIWLFTGNSFAQSESIFLDIISGKELKYQKNYSTESIEELNFYEPISFSYPQILSPGDSTVTEKVNSFLNTRMSGFVKSKEFRIMLLDHLKQASGFIVGEEANYAYGYITEWRDLLEPDLTGVEYEVLNFTHPIVTLRINYNYQPYLKRRKVGYGLQLSQTWYINLENGNVHSPDDVFKPDAMPALKEALQDQLRFWITQLPESNEDIYGDYNLYKRKPLPAKEKLLNQYVPGNEQGEFAFVMGDILFYYIPPFSKKLKNETGLLLHLSVSDASGLISSQGPLKYVQHLNFAPAYPIPVNEPITRALPGYQQRPFYTNNVLPPLEMTSGVKSIYFTRRSISLKGETGPPDTVSIIFLNEQNRLEKIVREREEITYQYQKGKLVRELSISNKKLIYVKDYQYKAGKLFSTLIVKYDQYEGHIQSVQQDVISYLEKGYLTVHLYHRSREIYSNAVYLDYSPAGEQTHRVFINKQTTATKQFYDEEGRVIAKIGDSPHRAESGPFYHYENGLLKYVEYDRWRYLYVYSYNSLGLPVKETLFDSYRKQNEWEFRYDENGRLSELEYQRNLWQAVYEEY